MGTRPHMKRKPKQYDFLGQEFKKPNDAFGGSLLKGNPKTKRPLDSKLPILLTLRAEKSVLRLPKTFKTVCDVIGDVCKKHGVKLYRDANVGNHLHLLVKIPHVRAWAAFIRELTGRIAQLVQIVLSGDVLGASSGFWKFRPHTRIVRGWQKAFKIASDYVDLNRLEAEGFISRRETKTLRDLRLIWADG